MVISNSSTTNGTARAAPPYDPELEAALILTVPQISPITAADIPQKRQDDQAAADQAQRDLRAAGTVWRDVQVAAQDNATLAMSLVHGPKPAASSPVIYFIHGGAMILGTRWSGYELFQGWIERYNAVIATVEYRLAPEHPFPTPQEDCYAALRWLGDNLEDHGFAPTVSLVAGSSGGGGLAASVAVMARDRRGPHVGGQLLLSPMLDDRNDTTSAHQYPDGLWNAAENKMAWQAVLEQRSTTDAGAIDVPSRVTNLKELPPAFIEAGSAEVFRDECVSYASRLWEAGVQTELHVWAGAFHGFDIHSHTSIAQGALGARHNWMDRMLGYSPRPRS